MRLLRDLQCDFADNTTTLCLICCAFHHTDTRGITHPEGDTSLVLVCLGSCECWPVMDSPCLGALCPAWPGESQLCLLSIDVTSGLTVSFFTFKIILGQPVMTSSLYFEEKYGQSIQQIQQNL